MTHKITATTRWTRTKSHEGGDWIEVDCFCFTAPDGKRSYADGLFPEQAAEFRRQEADRAAAAAEWEGWIEPSAPAADRGNGIIPCAETDRLVAGLGY